MILNKKLRPSAIFAAAMMFALLPLAAAAQTRVNAPKNKYKVQDDIKIGNDAARQVEQQMPLLNDGQAENYVARVGERLVSAIPAQFRQPAFDYRFKVVNASDINAFALPGGPMFVNRGMIEAARNEGEMAGVMAHEISHVALRHATAQQTKLNSPLNQILGIGAVIGGGLLGGQAGAQAGQIFAAGYFLRYSREYETQADILGARIMADAGYDPRDLANMFQTIARQGGGRGPEWLSSHPDPGNRYEKINREAELLNVDRNPIKITREFERIQSRLRAMPPAKSMEQIANDGRGNSGQSTNPTAGGRYTRTVAFPSARNRTYSDAGISLRVPDNWREFRGQSGLTFAPEGAYGDQGITHGTMIGAAKVSGGAGLLAASRDYVQSVLQGNSYLSQHGSLTRTNFAGRQGYTVTLSGRSPVTGSDETVTVYTAQLRSGDLFYAATVVPASETYRYRNAFRSILNSIQLND